MLKRRWRGGDGREGRGKRPAYTKKLKKPCEKAQLGVEHASKEQKTTTYLRECCSHSPANREQPERAS